MSGSTPIPNRLHFVWFGDDLPHFASLAMRSAKIRNPGSAVYLWHGQELASRPKAELSRAGIELLPIQLGMLAAEAGLDEAKLSAIYARLRGPASRSNLVRLLVLLVRGGVYLDTDTLTLRDLGGLRQARGFCGREHLLWPRWRRDMTKPYFWTVGPLLDLVRQVGARLPRGHELYRRSTRFYSTAVNNAVLGFAPGHPMLGDAIERIFQLPDDELGRRFRLGTHLLQELLDTPGVSRSDVELLGPEYFYPLGPVISAQYFRRQRDPAKAVSEIVSDDTYVLHWYASVSDLSRLDETYIRANASRTVYAHLCAPLL